MVPDAKQVIVIRTCVVAMLRVAGIIMFFVAWSPFVSAIVEGLTDSDLFSFFSYYVSRFVTSLTMFVLSAILFFAARPLARVVAPVATVPTCPRCEYELAHLTTPTCPECGLPLTDDFLSSPAATSNEESAT